MLNNIVRMFIVKQLHETHCDFMKILNQIGNYVTRWEAIAEWLQISEEKKNIAF
jgi:hypothetical protein